MTSEGETQKTSEFLRRRKLRLQQVREQSKDIAKKIRQRAKVEKLRQVVVLDEKKERDYIQSQEKVVNKLEEFYSRGLDNVGSSHRQASELTQPVSESLIEKTDLSHIRGREAAAELKKQKQQKLNELKKSLDRKVQAREAANILSREKSATAANKLSSKYSNTKLKLDEATKLTLENFTEGHDLNEKDLPKEVSRNDMGTQCDVDLLPPEWEPNIPALAIPQDDNIKESAGDSDKNTDKQKKLNLFALSDEMPASLRGGTHKPCETGPTKLSSTLVSEYIQNRALRLRESEVSTATQKHSEDLRNLRQTIIRNRPLKPEGKDFSNICHVVEGQAFPMPMWRAETNFQCQSPKISQSKQSPERKQFTNITHLDIDKIYSSVPVKPSSVTVPNRTRTLIPQNRSGYYRQSVNPSNVPSLRGKGPSNILAKKNSIKIYNHSTRDTRDVVSAAEPIVCRDAPSEKDAYSQALSESTSACDYEKQRKNLDTTNKIAMTRQNVEKEYKDTMAFLNSLPKNKNSRPIRNAYKDDHRLQAQRENRQRILQQEFKNIEQESRRDGSQGCRIKSTLPDRSHSRRSQSPFDLDENNLKDRDFQYSWMPVPESDSTLAVHSIPTGARPRGCVRFGKPDSYHEYRSRHKHTPPTKDTGFDRNINKRIVETLIFQKDNDSVSGLSLTSDNSSTDGRESEPEPNKNASDDQSKKEMTDAERIIIYKILNYKHRKKNNPSKINSADDIVQNTVTEKTPESSTKKAERGKVSDKVNNGPNLGNNNNPLTSDNINEGVYEFAGNPAVSYNILNATDLEPWQSTSDRKHWWDNLESTYYAELNKNQSQGNDSKCDKHKQGSCSQNTGTENDLQQSRKKCSSLKCKRHSSERPPAAEKASDSANTAAEALDGPRGAGFLKLLDDGEKQEGNFYIGATGFLKDDAYEVIIQLRKKDAVKEMTKKEEVVPESKTTDAEHVNTNTIEKVVAQPLESKYHDQQEAISVNERSPSVEDPQSPITDRDSVTTADIHAAIPTQDQKSTEQPCPTSARTDEVLSAKTKHDRSVSTSFKDIYPSSQRLAKSDPIARSATSTYTQTTLSSPNPRPVYIHMSSSTSTAYMSPPEVVLPSFLRRRQDSCGEAHRANIDRHKDKKMSRQEHRIEHRCKKYSSRKVSRKIVTEPKIDMLCSTATDVGYGSYNMYKEKKEAILSSPGSHMTTNRCPKCKPRGDSKLFMYCKKHSHQIKHQLNTAKPSKSIRNTRSTVLRNKKCKPNMHSNKSFLNPRIKEYIHQLLSLNREGIKAIQVINQDCSSVNTPGSSIINIPTNLSNKTCRRRSLDFSLEHIKHVLKQRIFLNDHFSVCRPADIKTENIFPKNIKLRKRNLKKKKLHKVKSLNISRKIVIKPSDASSKTRVTNSPKKHFASNLRNQGSPSLDYFKSHEESSNGNNILNIHTTNKALHDFKNQYVGDDSSSGQPKTAISSENTSPNSNGASTRGKCTRLPINTATQTSRTVDDEMNFIKLAEDKLQNMEKIADLTEKCSKRLSNLAKVLEEVRKNKSLAYSQISTPETTSDSDQRSDKITAESAELKCPQAANSIQNSKDEYNVDSTDYESLLLGLPKPGSVETSEINHFEHVLSNNSNTNFNSQPTTSANADCRVNYTKCRNKPPPALLRINSKRPQVDIVPHELSTVIEVDSPLSVKFKSQLSTTNINQSTKNYADPKKNEKSSEKHLLNPESITSHVNKSSNDKVKVISADPLDDSKLQMMDLNQFNEIMLKPFISLQEYAQDFYDVNMDTKYESIPKENRLTDDISSFHSDGSLPDVVAELLKRKLITEPFRFDTASNVNSTTISSESNLSVLALSKVRKDSKSALTANKENVGEISDSLSISSNPDLENAFKKLGMGWASSTLKKTKERLALSSSSNTSSSSLSHIKFKNTSKTDALVADSIASVPNLPKKPVLKRQSDASKNVEQQTSFTNSMTVKEFLTKELAKKITFTDKSDKNDTNLEFVSLFETKLPEELKNSSQIIEENSGDSAPSGNNNRARTSTPVNIFKSVTYHSSSSSNTSNGLFSNADDLSSVKLTSTSMRYQSTSEKDELTIPNCSLKMRKALSDCSKTDSC